MANQLGMPDLEGGVDSFKDYPKMVSLDVSHPLRQLLIYTQGMKLLAAPIELCLQKAIELMQDKNSYEMNVQILKLELLEDTIDNEAVAEANGLAAGICAICKYLEKMFQERGITYNRFFPYQFHTLYAGKQLLLSLINVDPSLSIFTTTNLPKPAYCDPQYQIPARQAVVTKEYHCWEV